MKLDDVLHIDTTATSKIKVGNTTEDMPLYQMARWSALMLGIDYIEKRAGELKIDLGTEKSWMKPLALQKYIDESTPGMVTDIKNLQDNGDVL